MKRLFILITFSCLLFLQGSFAQVDLQAPLPQDPNIVTGKLPNGIVYYLRHNEEPKGRASFYIIRNAGALLENDEQDGLAHFLEHMAFQLSLIHILVPNTFCAGVFAFPFRSPMITIPARG